jgi:hypothetical protein
MTDIAMSDRVRLVTLTDGNVRNSHVYLKSIIDFFPTEAIGAGNKREGMGKSVVLQFQRNDGSFDMCETDIDGKKWIFRSREPWRNFFRNQALSGGDQIIIERISKAGYRIYPRFLEARAVS